MKQQSSQTVLSNSLWRHFLLNCALDVKCSGSSISNWDARWRGVSVIQNWNAQQVPNTLNKLFSSRSISWTGPHRSLWWLVETGRCRWTTETRILTRVILCQTAEWTLWCWSWETNSNKNISSSCTACQTICRDVYQKPLDSADPVLNNLHR